MESATRRSKQKRAVSAHSTSHPNSEWYLEEGGRGRDSRSHPGDGDQTLGMRGLGASENVDLSPDVWGASPSRSAPPLGGQTALLVRQKHHLSGSECESGSGGVSWAAEWFVRERVWTVMSRVCIFSADVHLPLDLDQGIIFRVEEMQTVHPSVCVDLSCSTQPPPSSLTKSHAVKKKYIASVFLIHHVQLLMFPNQIPSSLIQLQIDQKNKVPVQRSCTVFHRATYKTIHSRSLSCFLCRVFVERADSSNCWSGEIQTARMKRSLS